jgi:hypothetical protein
MDRKKFLAELTLRNVYKIAREILGNHFRQPQQSRLELGCVSAVDCEGRTIWIADARSNIIRPGSLW